MSRSFRRTPIFPITTCESEKEDKRIANRAFRRKTKVAILTGRELPMSMDEVSNPWSWGKDGKNYWPEAPKKWLTK